MSFRAGQVWRYRAPDGFEASRILIGAIAAFGDGGRIVCCAVTHAPQKRPDGSVSAVTIPFLPMTEAALAASVIDKDADAGDALPEAFVSALDEWQNDPRGATCFTVAFDGYLDHLIARQMAAIVGVDAA